MATKGQEVVDIFSEWLPMATWQLLLSSPALMYRPSVITSTDSWMSWKSALGVCLTSHIDIRDDDVTTELVLFGPQIGNKLDLETTGPDGGTVRGQKIRGKIYALRACHREK